MKKIQLLIEIAVTDDVTPDQIHLFPHEKLDAFCIAAHREGDVPLRFIDHKIQGYETRIKNRTEVEKPTEIFMVWSIGDFETIAKQLEDVDTDAEEQYTDENPMLYDRSKFSEALYLMERRHDCNYGVTWETVEYYLNEYCRLQINPSVHQSINQ